MMKRFKLDFNNIIDPYLLGITPSNQYISHLFSKIKRERYYAYIIGEDDATAHDSLFSFIEDSAFQFTSELSLIDDKLADMLKLEIKSTKETESNTTREQTDEAVTDSSIEDVTDENILGSGTDSILNKVNETPDAGNIDLTGDTYISESRRQESLTSERTNIRNYDRNFQSILGERNRNSLDYLEALESLTQVDNFKQLEMLGNLRKMINNIYDEWLKYIDTNCFVYSFL